MFNDRMANFKRYSKQKISIFKLMSIKDHLLTTLALVLMEKLGIHLTAIGPQVG